MPITRRDFVKTTAALAAATQLPALLRAQSSAAPAPGSVPLHWLEGGTPAALTGATWGVPWPRGSIAHDVGFALRSATGESVPVQSWPLAFWPDGSLKWTGHALAGDTPAATTYTLAPGTPAAPARAVRVTEDADHILVDTGVVSCRVAKKGSTLIAALVRDGREIARDGRLICLRQDQPELDATKPLTMDTFTGEIDGAVIEQRGPVRAVVRVTGRHVNAAGRAWLPFTVRLYFYAGGEAVRIMHTFVFDGDEQQDFIRGLGVRFAVPLRDELHDRHVRFIGEGAGLWGEGVRNITGLRRDPGRAVRAAQVAGTACPPVAEWAPTVSKRLDLIPAWGDCTLAQLSANAFTIRKRTKAGHGWIPADQGGRAGGTGYLGGVTGGVAFGLRDFWQRHPTQLDIRHAHTATGEVTVWLWSPDAPAMDIRFYHDGMGMDTYPKQLEGLEITYEDYEPGFGSPHGVARTSEITLWALAATPTRERLAQLADAVRTPPQLVAAPEHYLAAGVFGRLWSLPDRSTPARAAVEDRLDWSFDYYLKQVGQRHWYGFWDYGDVMHTYDADRHVWRYDVGGFAWDNSELSPDLWLWYGWLRSGRADIFRLGEAMTRHNSEVDTYHLGRFAGFGSRHNVQHWGCSAKQLRISTAVYRRFYYYLTADERTGDILHELVDADAKLADLNPTRKLPGQPVVLAQARIGVGTDWGSAASNWLTEWERTGDPRVRGWLEAAMKVIGGRKTGFFGGTFGYEPKTKTLIPLEGDRISVSHLSAVFGLVEVCAELIDLIPVPEFEKAWLQYCTLYNATPADQQLALGQALRGTSLRVGHSRLTAYAAHRRQDAALAQRAWAEFASREWGGPVETKTVRLTGPAVLNPVDEAAWVSTNDSGQWGLAAIQNLALAGNALAVR
ncbi:MAG: twin-arginine translocation signal domain-containing protein [Lacunisphaera sp.]|nr:twin-arginine translocation signal domain-containing protein [Lacunisphaera sp.]